MLGYIFDIDEVIVKLSTKNANYTPLNVLECVPYEEDVLTNALGTTLMALRSIQNIKESSADALEYLFMVTV